ncbi:MAG: hypothetical protein WAT12_13120 [Candidatus Nitrotoga sp.]
MSVISINFNGIRSVCSKDLLPWLARQEGRIICVQELKAHSNSSAALLGTIPPLAFNSALKANPSRAQRINKPNHWQKRSASRAPY